jgi:hypothetical protein
MSGLGFLMIAVVLSVSGSVVLWYRHRPPTSLRHGIDSFQREMKAIAPDRRSQRRRGDGENP